MEVQQPELKKHSSRLVGGAEMGSEGEEDSQARQQGISWRTRVGEAVASREGSPTCMCE